MTEDGVTKPPGGSDPYNVHCSSLVYSGNLKEKPQATGGIGDHNQPSERSTKRPDELQSDKRA